MVSVIYEHFSLILCLFICMCIMCPSQGHYGNKPVVSYNCFLVLLIWALSWVHHLLLYNNFYVYLFMYDVVMYLFGCSNKIIQSNPKPRTKTSFYTRDNTKTVQSVCFILNYRQSNFSYLLVTV